MLTHEERMRTIRSARMSIGQMQDENERLKAENAAMREVVQAVAHHGEYENWSCIFGGECDPVWNVAANDYDHAPDCLVTKARAILDKQQQPE